MSAQMSVPAHSTSPAPPSKTFVAMGFVAATLVTTLLTSVGSLIVGDLQSKNNQKRDQVVGFEKTTQDFIGLTENFSTAILDKKNIGPARTKLEDNVQQQHELLNSALPYLSDVDEVEARAYLKTLEDMADALQTANDVVSAMPFARAAVRQAEERDEVVADLRETVGLPAKPKT